MASWDDVSRLATSMPQAREERRREQLRWSVRERLFVWERPLRKSDLRALGDEAPTGAILGARVEHLVAKDALLADDPEVYFTIPHFDGYTAILVRLEQIGLEGLEELVVEAWLAVAPPRLVREYLEARAG